MKCVILMAGIGSRLGNPFPKCLTPLTDRQTILDHQLAKLDGHRHGVISVVGFKKDLVMECHPELMFVYNSRYDQTNTAKSLLCALEHIHGEDVLWLNGDVVFDARVVTALIRQRGSCMAVNKSRVGEEEIKYRTRANGAISEVSKQVVNGEGEAVGVNLIKARDLELFKKCLRAVNDGDYFERALELAIGRGLKLYPVDISRFDCLEVDFPDDLTRAQALFVNKPSAKARTSNRS
ncbi:MAG TPA: phosphocholine cytidylyltransferase family protein [Verrucomicrobiae bacterium]|nr:phosphocholine cytidylyltransferase family protein [Verrucomicrobiae bacterium]